MGTVSDLRDEGLISVAKTTAESVELTDEGVGYANEGLLEVWLYHATLDAGDGDAVPTGQVIGASSLGGPQADTALSDFVHKGHGRIGSGEPASDADIDPGADEGAVALATLAVDGSADGDVPDQLELWNLAAHHGRIIRAATLTDEGVTVLMEGAEAAKTAGRLTPKLLISGEWGDVEFTEHDIEIDTPETRSGKKHILRQTADHAKDVLTGIGFAEMEGPRTNVDFWINDCLFMPRDHPTRTHWDCFVLSVPSMEDIPEDLIDRVRDTHLSGIGGDGDGYHSPRFEDLARAIALRGHTTSLSIRYLSDHKVGELKPPQWHFSVEKVYHNDAPDPIHLLEPYQIKGWVMTEDLSVRNLVGTFEGFYFYFGTTDIQFKPHYNSYTEPSFGLFGRHPEMGELIEIGNSDTFREEVLRPFGVEYDVTAWGLALRRLLILMYGFDDIHDVYGTLCDLDLLREVEVLK